MPGEARLAAHSRRKTRFTSSGCVQGKRAGPGSPASAFRAFHPHPAWRAPEKTVEKEKPPMRPSAHDAGKTTGLVLTVVPPEAVRATQRAAQLDQLPIGCQGNLAAWRTAITVQRRPSKPRCRRHAPPARPQTSCRAARERASAPHRSPGEFGSHEPGAVRRRCRGR